MSMRKQFGLKAMELALSKGDAILASVIGQEYNISCTEYLKLCEKYGIKQPVTYFD